MGTEASMGFWIHADMCVPRDSETNVSLRAELKFSHIHNRLHEYPSILWNMDLKFYFLLEEKFRRLYEGNSGKAAAAKAGIAIGNTLGSQLEEGGPVREQEGGTWWLGECPSRPVLILLFVYFFIYSS